MQAFVTGASGFIGSHLVRRLVEDGWHVRALVHKTEVSTPGVETILGEIRNFALLKTALPGTDVLFHLASALGASRIGKREFFGINAEGTRAVLDAAEEAGVSKIIHFSSAGVFGHIRRGEIAGENAPVSPLDVYDKSKLEGERIVLESARRGQKIFVIRPGWVYGPGDRRTFKLIRSIARKRFILVSKGKILQTPVYIDDLIQGTLLCAEKGRPGEVYHLAGPEALPVAEIVRKIAAATDSRIPRFSLPLPPVRIAAWILGKTFSLAKREAPLSPSRLAFFIHPKPLSIEKAVRDLGYSPRWNFDRGIAAAVAWYRFHGWL
jgi:nucleoside-diphosphate-sugar epimerase